MNKKIFNIGITILVVGIILVIISTSFNTIISYSDDLYPLISISPILIVLGILLFITGIVFTIIGAFTKEEIKTQFKPSSVMQSQSSQNQSFYCRSCGEKLPNDSTFCNKCGKKV